MKFSKPPVDPSSEFRRVLNLDMIPAPKRLIGAYFKLHRPFRICRKLRPRRQFKILFSKLRPEALEVDHVFPLFRGEASLHMPAT